jgi:hypothetical protein
LVFAGVAALALLAYGSGLSVGFVSDDHYWLQSAVRGGWRYAFYLSPHSNALPVEWLIQSLKYQLFGFSALGFHLFDLAGHIVVCSLVFLLGRQIGLPAASAAAAALFAAVASAPSQAVYWTSSDPHVWATLCGLASIVLYVKSRQEGRATLLAWSIILAFVGALTKFEGIVAVFGVLAYELVWGSPQNWSTTKLWLVSRRSAPYVAAAAVFVAWELTAVDRLRGVSNLGPHMFSRAREILQIILLPYDPFAIHPHHWLSWFAFVGLASVAAILLLTVGAAFTRRLGAGLALLWIGPLLPVLTLTDALQPRYAYLPTVVASLLIAGGGVVVVDWLRSWTAIKAFAYPLAAITLFAVLSAGVIGTVYAAQSLRSAEKESTALTGAVLAGHPTLAPDTTIYLVGSTIDSGSAHWAFADPRLGAEVNANLPKIAYAPSVDSVRTSSPPSPYLIYVRQADGTYTEAT